MKAIDKDRTRRYATASEFAADIHHYLAQEPVSARAPSILYKLGKFSRRHKIGIAVTALLVIALLAGIIGTTIGLMRAREAEKIAQKEAAQARAINRFMQDTLGSANPVEGRSRDITVLEALEASIDKIHESFIEQPQVEAELKSNIGITFLRLGKYDKAETVFAEASALGLEQLGEKNQDVAKIRAKYGECLARLNKYEPAEEQLEMALSLLKESLGLEDSRTQKVISSLAEICDVRGNIDRAAQFRALLIEKRQQAP